MTAPQISIDRAKVAAKAADEKLGKNIAVIDVAGVMAITDVFVVVELSVLPLSAVLVELSL